MIVTVVVFGAALHLLSLAGFSLFGELDFKRSARCFRVELLQHGVCRENPRGKG